jgi:hypothetical protein
MPVKRSQSGLRIIAVLETVVRHQPVGVTELARLLGADKGAIQRALMTLADSDWITQAAVTRRWRISARFRRLVRTDLYGNFRPSRRNQNLSAAPAVGHKPSGVAGGSPVATKAKSRKLADCSGDADDSLPDHQL